MQKGERRVFAVRANVHDMERLYAEYAQAIYKYLVSLGCDIHTAEDLVQDTFYQAIRSINRYDGTCKISVWLCQIAKHLWYRELERRNKYPVVALSEHIRDENDMIGDAWERETKTQLETFIAEFPEKPRQVVQYRIYGNMSFREIGFVLGETENWARVTFYRCKNKIIERWREKYEH